MEEDRLSASGRSRSLVFGSARRKPVAMDVVEVDDDPGPAVLTSYEGARVARGLARPGPGVVDDNGVAVRRQRLV